MLGDRIKQRRNELNWTQDELSAKAGISKSFLSEIENGKKSIGADTLLNLSKALSCSLDYLMQGVETDKEKIEVEIPSKLAQFADSNNISFRETLLLLKMRRQIVAHRSSIKKDASDDCFDWQKFYESVKEFL